MIISLLKLKPIPEKRQAILEILRFVKENVQLKRGCLESGIYQACEEFTMILYLETWQSKEEMDRHIQSDLYLRLLNAMDLCREKPDTCFHEVSEAKGLELVERLRIHNGFEVNPSKTGGEGTSL